MRRLLFVIGSLGGGGAERIITQLADVYVRQGVEVHLATFAVPSVRDFYSVDGRVRRHRLSFYDPGPGFIGRLHRGVAIIRSLRALIRHATPDCIVSFIDKSNVISIVAATGLGVRLVVSERSDPRANGKLSAGWRVMRALAYQRACLVVAQTEGVANWMNRRWRVRTLVIPNFLRSLPQPSVDRQYLLISIGRLVPEKGFDLAIRAFSRIAHQHPRWHYAILGDGPSRHDLVDLCHRLGLSDRVSFVGQVKNIEHWLARASIGVQPSRFEGFPNAVMELMAMGVATISADCPSGPRDLINHMDNGFLVPVDDVEATARAMDCLMSDGCLRRSLGSRAIAIRETLAESTIVGRWNAALSGRAARSQL